MSRGKVHWLTVLSPSPATRTAEGTWTQTEDGERFAGRAAVPSREEQRQHDQTGEQIDCVALLPRAATVRRQDRVEVASTGPLGLDGIYEVQGVRPNQLHQRVMLRRWVP